MAIIDLGGASPHYFNRLLDPRRAGDLPSLSRCIFGGEKDLGHSRFDWQTALRVLFRSAGLTGLTGPLARPWHQPVRL